MDWYLQSKLQQQSNEPEKTMEVCQVCGALLVVGDVQQRIDEHLMGKQHAGYARIRAFVEDWKQVGVCNCGGSLRFIMSLLEHSNNLTIASDLQKIKLN